MIYSCSLFYNELDLLELKLETMWDVVDYFIIQESTKTHSGNKKPLYLLDNIDRFEKYSSKLMLRLLTDTPDDYNNLSENRYNYEEENLVIRKVNSQKHRHKCIPSYGRDCYEKESLIKNLDAKNDDIILLSDLDEIAKPERVLKTLSLFDPNQIYYLMHDPYYYYMNVRKDEISFGTIMLTYERFLRESFSAMREEKNGIRVENSGWHFTYMGDVRSKIEAYSHQEFNNESVKSAKFNINSNRDTLGLPARFWKVPITYDTHPKYLVENLDKYRKYIYE